MPILRRHELSEDERRRRQIPWAERQVAKRIIPLAANAADQALAAEFEADEAAPKAPQEEPPGEEEVGGRAKVRTPRPRVRAVLDADHGRDATLDLEQVALYFPNSLGGVVYAPFDGQVQVIGPGDIDLLSEQDFGGANPQEVVAHFWHITLDPSLAEGSQVLRGMPLGTAQGHLLLGYEFDGAGDGFGAGFFLAATLAALQYEALRHGR